MLLQQARESSSPAYHRDRPPCTKSKVSCRFFHIHQGSTLVGVSHGKEKRGKTYNSQDSLLVTHATTNWPIRSLNMAERTGCLVFYDLWSYVIVMVVKLFIYPDSTCSSSGIRQLELPGRKLWRILGLQTVLIDRIRVTWCI